MNRGANRRAWRSSEREREGERERERSRLGWADRWAKAKRASWAGCWAKVKRRLEGQTGWLGQSGEVRRERARPVGCGRHGKLEELDRFLF